MSLHVYTSLHYTLLYRLKKFDLNLRINGYRGHILRRIGPMFGLQSV